MKRLVALALALLPLAAAARSAAAPSSAKSAVLPFREDDYEGALAAAKAQHKLLFVDAWATWCHSCLSMQRFVLRDRGMRPAKDAVVWLAVETEQEKNRAFVEKYAIDGLPTFFLIDPVREEVFARWLGSGSVSELRDFVQTHAAAYEATRARAQRRPPPPRAGSGEALSPAARATFDGDQARQRDDGAGAAAGYRKAVQLSDAGDKARPERLVLLANALLRLHTPEAARECTALGAANLDRTGASAVAADFASYTASCAESLKDDPDAKRLRKAAEAKLAALTADRAAPLSIDDRSDALANLAELQDADGRHPDAVATMQRRAALLEAGAAAAPDATLASTFDAHRTDTYLYLGQPAKAEAMLREREQQIGDDYNPPARLARVLFEEKKFPEAEAAIDRALARMTRGPRRIGILGLKGKILAAQNKPRDGVLREQLEVLRKLPAIQRRPEQEKQLETELAAIGPHAAR